MSINNTPVEILRNIFEIFVEDTLESRPSKQETARPQILCSVCRVWRDVALHDPLLWRFIHFVPTEAGVQHCERLLQRSLGVPLDIYITKELHHSDGDLRIASYGKQFLDLAGAASHRWRTLELDIPVLDMALEPLWKGETPMLEKLEIDFSSSSLSESFNPAVLPHYGKLTSFTIAQFPLRWDQWSCTSVTHLSMGPFTPSFRGPNAGELCGILWTLSDTLSSLTMQGPWYLTPEEIVAVPKPIILKHLKSFSSTSFWASYVEQAFSSCRFPALEEVELTLPWSENVPLNFTWLLCEEPQLLGSAKRANFFIVPPIPMSHMAILQCAFPQMEKIHITAYIPLEPSMVTFLSTSWVALTHLILSESDLPGAKDLLSARFQNYTTPLQKFELLSARGTLCRIDYEWIRSHVGQFTISLVRTAEDPPNFSPFEESYLMAWAP